MRAKKPTSSRRANVGVGLDVPTDVALLLKKIELFDGDLRKQLRKWLLGLELDAEETAIVELSVHDKPDVLKITAFRDDICEVYVEFNAPAAVARYIQTRVDEFTKQREAELLPSAPVIKKPGSSSRMKKKG